MPSNKAINLTLSSKVVIVGSGCFGISTALHLLQRGYTNVTVLDRAPSLPAVDAASTDMNKVVRSSYHDAFYTRLAREAIAAWKNREDWGDVYHESGVLVYGTGESIYVDGAYVNDIAHGARVKKVAPSAPVPMSKCGTENDTVALAELFPGVPLGPAVAGKHGYLNVDGGWAYAEGGVARAMQLVTERGGRFLRERKSRNSVRIPDKVVKRSRTTGVKCKDGSEYPADIVVLATGSWTASAFPDLNLGERCLASGQSVGTIQLTPEEGERYRNCPVVLDFGHSGFYVFPPNEDNIVKFAKHTGGVAHYLPLSEGEANGNANWKVSTPRTVLSHGADGLKIPRSEAKYIQDCLREVYPELAKKPFRSTRLCWYTDSPDSDWVIDVHPTDPGLAFATSGSGHGYKFLPVIGRLVADRLEGKMDVELQRKFAVDRVFCKSDLSRDVSRLGVLNVDELCGPEDL
ncbi:FAD dependent oxidoreductase [Phellopilus nigrolimitatus]|nr:FAD dependent oxidoreductase [Phellopilus nigrolimitatus]